MPNQTPAKKTAKKAAAKAAPKQAPMNVLYSVPEGWEYTVAIDGPDEALIEVSPTGTKGNLLVVRTKDGGERRSNYATMPEALRAASKAAKALNDVAKKRAALAEAEKDSLSFLGAGEPTGD